MGEGNGSSGTNGSSGSSGDQFILSDTYAGRPIHTLITFQGQHEYYLRYRNGYEDEAVDQLYLWAANEGLNFTWEDAGGGIAQIYSLAKKQNMKGNRL